MRMRMAGKTGAVAWVVCEVCGIPLREWYGPVICRRCWYTPAIRPRPDALVYDVVKVCPIDWCWVTYAPDETHCEMEHDEDNPNPCWFGDDDICTTHGVDMEVCYDAGRMRWRPELRPEFRWVVVGCRCSYRLKPEITKDNPHICGAEIL